MRGPSVQAGALKPHAAGGYRPNLAVGESIHGLRERLGGFNKADGRTSNVSLLWAQLARLRYCIFSSTMPASGLKVIQSLYPGGQERPPPSCHLDGLAGLGASLELWVATQHEFHIRLQRGVNQLIPRGHEGPGYFGQPLTLGLFLNEGLPPDQVRL